MAQYSMYKSHQGGNVLAYNGHEYLYKRSNQDGSIVWRCRKYFSLKCHVTLTTKGQQIVKQPNDHEHPGDPLNTQKNKCSFADYRKTGIALCTRKKFKNGNHGKMKEKYDDEENDQLKI
ncbi:hypothetical protein HELRODRAFT_165071 [Helobdella robusta]|uniref:FLYWCH-type domain-containing protein n=1 Tax=Helobdella robusta TaxID=6412 RepID=T1EW90_HELRO|nr:hypothetical protein HELRODRAFT_165071 [Helobdella robusta]ESN92933.1 hypothetical protein HELRODRAFT_165071 [Helobdella robusta]